MERIVVKANGREWVIGIPGQLSIFTRLDPASKFVRALIRARLGHNDFWIALS